MNSLPLFEFNASFRKAWSVFIFLLHFSYILHTLFFLYALLCTKSLAKLSIYILMKLKYQICIATLIRQTTKTYWEWMEDNLDYLWNILKVNHQQSWRAHSYPTKQRLKVMSFYEESEKWSQIFLFKRGSYIPGEK